MALGLAITALAAVIWLASILRGLRAEKVLQQDLARIREALADGQILHRERNSEGLTRTMVRGDPGRAGAPG